jgi:hypothetical protein
MRRKQFAGFISMAMTRLPASATGNATVPI